MTEEREPVIELHPRMPCHLCGDELLFAAQVPITVDWIAGQSVTARRTVTLCPRCHRDDLAAQGLLAFLAIHERITSETAQEAGTLICEWMATTTSKTYTNDDLDADIHLWEVGNM